MSHRIFKTSFARVYPHYVAKAEKKGRTRAEVDTVIRRLRAEPLSKKFRPL